MKILKIQWSVLFLVMALLLWAPVSGTAQAEEVKFLDLSDFTGPVAGLALPGSMGTEDYIKDINAKGGIDGVKIKYIGVDTRYDVARGLSATS
jgi:branched-chain amino acid transport system substrate-binding protein